jgi:hypothetical protein
MRLSNVTRGFLPPEQEVVGSSPAVRTICLQSRPQT